MYTLVAVAIVIIGLAVWYYPSMMASNATTPTTDRGNTTTDIANEFNQTQEASATFDQSFTITSKDIQGL